MGTAWNHREPSHASGFACGEAMSIALWGCMAQNRSRVHPDDQGAQPTSTVSAPRSAAVRHPATAGAANGATGQHVRCPSRGGVAEEAPAPKGQKRAKNRVGPV